MVIAHIYPVEYYDRIAFYAVITKDDDVLWVSSEYPTREEVKTWILAHVADEDVDVVLSEMDAED